MRDILVLKKWFEGLENAPEKDLREIGFRIVQVVLEKENEIDSSKDVYPMSKIWKDISKEIFGTYDAYIKKKQYGEDFGKQMDPASILTWQYCQSHPGAKASDVGEFLISKGIDKKGSPANKKGLWSKIYDLDGWKNRKDPNWGVGKNSEISSEILKENSENSSEKEEKSSEILSGSFLNF